MRSLNRVPPTTDEAAELHDLYLRHVQNTSSLDVERVWMEDTKLENCLLMFPQERKRVNNPLKYTKNYLSSEMTVFIQKFSEVHPPTQRMVLDSY